LVLYFLDGWQTDYESDVMRYNPRNGKVYWAINDGSSFTFFALAPIY